MQLKTDLGKHYFIHTGKRSRKTLLYPYSKKVICGNTVLYIQQKSHIGKHCFIHAAKKSYWKTLLDPCS
jgi:hypothetical protein